MDIKMNVTLVEMGGNVNLKELRNQVLNALREMPWQAMGIEYPSLYKVSFIEVSAPLQSDEKIEISAE